MFGALRTCTPIIPLESRLRKNHVKYTFVVLDIFCQGPQNVHLASFTSFGFILCFNYTVMIHHNRIFDNMRHTLILPTGTFKKDSGLINFVILSRFLFLPNLGGTLLPNTESCLLYGRTILG